MKENEQEQLIKAAEILYKTYKYESFGGYNNLMVGFLWYDHIHFSKTKKYKWSGSDVYLKKLKLI